MELYSELTKLGAVFKADMEQFQKKIDTSLSQKSLEALSSEFNSFKKLMWETLNMLKRQVELLHLGLDRHEMSSRRKILLFHGIPEGKDPSTEAAVCKVISGQMKLVGFTECDISSCHRLGRISSKPRPVLVRFQSFTKRSQVWDSKTSLKSSGVTVSQFLTKSRHDVFKRARDHFGVKQCWTTEGKITILCLINLAARLSACVSLMCLLSSFRRVIKRLHHLALLPVLPRNPSHQKPPLRQITRSRNQEREQQKQVT
ncbi:hypothetical protein NE865_11984 [Phthorimaea operculella]|nr:hypothetical protein NE865_11984 [Phthorimaea operculella]